MAELETTWGGLPVAREPPYASCVVVWRRAGGAREYLVLHRLAPGGPEFEGDWAWTPPSEAGSPASGRSRGAPRRRARPLRLALRAGGDPTLLPAEVSACIANAARLLAKRFPLS